MSELRVETISNNAGTGPANLTGQSAAKAWSALTTDAGTAGDDFNQSSITDNGTGDNTHNFTNSFASAVFCPTVAIHDTNTTQRVAIQDSGGDTAGSAQIQVSVAGSGNSSDRSYSATWHGDLA